MEIDPNPKTLKKSRAVIFTEKKNGFPFFLKNILWEETVIESVPTRKKQELGRTKKLKNPSEIFTSIFTNSFSQLLFLRIKSESENRKKLLKKELGVGSYEFVQKIGVLKLCISECRVSGKYRINPNTVKSKKSNMQNSAF